VRIAIPIFDQITALDAVGPYEVLSRLPGAEVVFVAREPGPRRTENGVLALTADAALCEVPHPEVIVVPGGFGTRALMSDETILEWLRVAHATSQWTTSVCTGALLLGAPGLLDGCARRRTGWSSRRCAGSAPSPCPSGSWSRAR
jgi:putative intracellular protease/amidase